MSDASYSVLLLSGLAAGCGSGYQKIPSTDTIKVEMMEAKLETPEIQLDTFAIEPSDYVRVFRLFDCRVRDRERIPWEHAGGIQITYDDGRRCRITLLRTGEEVGAYLVGDTGYRGSNDDEILSTIKYCYRRSGKPAAK